MPKFPGPSGLAQTARLYLNANQTPTTGTVVAISTGWVVDYAVGTAITANATAGSLTTTVAGLYVCNIEMNFVGGGSGARTVLARINGATRREYGTTSTDSRAAPAWMLSLSAGDILTVAVYVTGTAPVVQGSSGGTPVQKNVGIGLTYLGPLI